MKRSQMEDIDRISRLPEHIIQTIVSRLPTKYATRTSVLSKKFKFAWSSLPVLDFDTGYSTRWKTRLGKLEFLEHMHDCILRRAPVDIDLEKFRLHYDGLLLEREHIVDEAIAYALEKNVKELDLCFSYPFGYVYTMQAYVYSENSLKVLKLSGLNMTNVEHLNLPVMEELNLQRCEMGGMLQVSSDRLKVVEFSNCIELSQVDIHSTTLTSFSCQMMNSTCKINLTTCKSLKSLILRKVGITNEWFEDTLPQLLLLETLVLNGCGLLEDINVTNPNLKTIQICNCVKLTSIVVLVVNLEVFVFEAHVVGWECSINIEDCTFLKVLEICKASITSGWVERTMSRLCFLEHIKLSICHLLVGLIVYNNALKHLELDRCPNLVEMEIHSRNLTSFKYVGQGLHPNFCIDSPILEADLTLHEVIPLPYRVVRNFLGFFDHCKSLSLRLKSLKYLSFPRDVREHLLPPLYDIKHLNIVSPSPLESLTEFVDSLLWLSPLLETITFTSPRKMNKSIQLEYVNARAAFEEENNILGEKDMNCCNKRAIKCWHHFVKKVSTENFTVSEEEKLRQYFREQATGLEYISSTGANNTA